MIFLGIFSWSDYINNKTVKCLEQINTIQTDLVMYTNSSATGGSKDGGFAAVITEGPANNLSRCQHHQNKKKRKHWKKHWTTLTFIYADRKSFCEVILEKNPCVSPVQLLLNIIYTKFTIKVAKETTISPSAVLPPVALSSSLHDINYVIKDGPITHEELKKSMQNIIHRSTLHKQTINKMRQ